MWLRSPARRWLTIAALLLGAWLIAVPRGAAAAELPRDSLVASPPLSRRWQTAVFRPDRFQHASLSLGIGVGVGMLAHDRLAGSATALGIGLAKEMIDDHFDRGDLLADTVGAALAALVVAALTR